MKSDLPERTFAFAEKIVRFCMVLEKDSIVSGTLMKQLLRSGTSIGSNVEEGRASESKRDFVHKYSLSLKEARQTHYWLRLLTAAEVLPAARLQPLTGEANELIAILTTICKRNRE
jgi:four helix bundle protein